MSLRFDAPGATAITRLLRASAALGLALAVGTCGGDGPTGVEVSAIEFGLQPSSSAVAGAPIRVAVQALSPSGGIVRSFDGTVTIAITAGTGKSGATLLGTTTVAAANGVATFADLRIDSAGTGYTLTATAPSLPPVSSSSFAIVAGPLSRFTFSVQPGNGVAGTALTPAIEVTARDAAGNKVDAYSGNVTLALATNPPGASLSGTTTVAAAGGEATFAGLSVNKSGTYTLIASGGGVTSAPSAAFDVVPGPASGLVFSQQPSNAAAGAAIAPAVVVEARDSQGNRAITFAGSVTVAIAANPSGGALSGTKTVGVVNGVATFSTLSIDRRGSGYTLTASGGALPDVISAAFDIVPAPVSKLAFAAPLPASVTAGAAIAPAVQVLAQDALGNTVTDFTGAVTVAFGANPNGGTLSGTATVTAVNGVATFATLSIDKAGNGYTLAATSGTLAPGASTPLSVLPAPAIQLAFTVQPGSATAGVPIAPAVGVAARDQYGNLDTAFTGAVTVALAGPAGATLSGTATVAAANGVATFSTLSVNRVGGGYTLTASAGGLADATSAAFAVAPGQATELVFTVDPSSATASDPIAPPVAVTARDAQGNTATAFTGPVTVAIANNPGAATLAGTKTVAAVAGVATFSDLSVNKTGNGYTLSAVSGALTGDTSAAFDISGGSATQLAFTVQPVGATAGEAIPAIEVTARDAQGNVAADFGSNVTVAIAANPGTGTLSGTATVAAVGGVATFNGLSIDKSGVGYTLSASAGGLTDAASDAFNITSAAAVRLVFTTSPVTAAAGQPITPAVQVTARDAFDNDATGFTGDVTVALAANPAGGALAGATVATALAGVATFPTLSIAKAGAGYTLAAAAGSLDGDTSGTFNITPGPAAQLEFTAQPTNQSENLAIAPPVQVRARDAHGNVATGFGGDVTMTIGNNAGGGALSGATSVAAVAGVATFDDLRIDKNGNGYTLTASGTNLAAATSDAFDIIPSVLARLVFAVEPSDVTAGTPFAPAVRVEALDALDHLVPGFIGDVTLAIENNPGGGNLLGTATVAAVAGVATFNGLSIDKSGIGYTLSAGATGAPSVASTPFAVTPAAASQIVFTDPPLGTTAGATLAPVRVTARDAHGNTASDFAGDVTIALAANPGNGALAGTTTVAAVSGVATFSDLSIDKSGAGYTLAASAGALPAVTSGEFDIAPGAATRLVFTVSPDDATAGATLTPAVQVEAQDALGNVAPSFSGDVVVTIASNPGLGALGGTTTAAAAAGVATFGDLTIDKSGLGYTLAATAAGLDPATSAAFDIVAGAATQLVFKVPPVIATAGAPIAPAVELAAQDALGNTDLTFTGSVTVAITAGTGTPGAALAGTTTVSAIDGVAAFPTLSIDLTGGGYTLTATAAGVTDATSAEFAVTAGVATQLVFAAGPAEATAGTPFAPVVRVEARDGLGNLVPGFTGDITVAIANNPAGGTLSGTTTVAAVDGVATFSDLSIDKSGDGYTLSATAAALPPATNTAFNVVPGAASQLVFTGPPLGTTAGATLAPVQVTVRDAQGNTVTGFTDNVTVVIGANPGGGPLSGTTVVAAVAGVATFADLRIDNSGAGYTLQASAGALPVATSPPFGIAAGAATRLVFTVSPGPATAGAALTPVVQVTAQDSLDNTDPSFAGDVTVAITGGTGAPGATLSGATTVSAVSGVASFADLSIDKNGSAYTLSATAGGLSAATSTAFDVAAGAAAQLVFTVPPTTATAGAVITPAVEVAVRDALGNTVTTFTGDVTVSIAANPGSGTLSGSTTVAAVGGVAAFGDLSINKSGIAYALQASAGALPAATSPDFDIVAGAATHVAFIVSPGDATAGAALTPVVQVAAQDDLGNTDLTFTGDVIVAITPATGTAGAALSGQTTVAAASGVAAFSTLSIDSAGTNYTLTAATTGLTSGVSTAFAVAAGPAAQLAFTVQPVDVTAGQPITPAVQLTARDALGNVATSFTGDVAITLAVNPGAGTLGGATTVAAVAGVVTFGDLSVDKVGSGYRLQAGTGALTSPLSEPFAVGHGAATQLAFLQSPAVAEAGINFAPPLQVAARDAFGNHVTSFAANVTVNLGGGPPGAALDGVRTVAAIGGVATFQGLDIDETGTGYTLTATAAGLTGVTSTAFDVVPPTAAELVFTTLPSDGTAGEALPTIRVTARNAAGQTVTSFTDDVTLTITTNPGGGTLSGAPTVAAVNGVATFNNVIIDKSGNGYRLGATSGGLAATSIAFNVLGGTATHLEFTLQPSDAAVGAAITPQVEVTARDALGNRAIGFTGDVTVTFGTNPGGGTLNGTTTVAAVGGVAAFSTLSVNVAEVGYTLAAAAAGLTPDTSAAFDITAGAPNRLAFTAQPADGVAGVAIAPAVQVTAQDGTGATLAGYSGPVTVSITAGTGRSGAEGTVLFGTTTVSAVDGVATFPDLSITTRSSGYRLSATAPGFAGATSQTFTINAGPATELDFSVHPSPSVPMDAGSVITPAVEIVARDVYGNRVLDFAEATTLAIAVNPGGGTLSGATTVTPVGGTATFADLSIDRSGNDYRLVASAPGVAPDTSPAFDIAPLAPAAVIFTVQPGSVVRGLNISPSVRVAARDSLGNFVTGFNGNVTITIASNPAGGALLGVTTVTAVNGVAIFSNLSIDKAGNGYTLAASASGLAGATSTPFDVLAGTGDQLVFAVQPSDAVAGAAIAPPIEVNVLNAQGTLNTGFVGTVNLAISANPGLGTLMGTTSATVVNGVATFSILSIDKVGVGYTIRASVDGPTAGITSVPFDITQGAATRLVFTIHPTDEVAGVAIAPAVQVTAQDGFGNVATAYAGDVTVAIANNAGGGTLSGTLTASVVNGVATFANLSIDKSGAGYTLSATSGSLDGATSAPFAITAAGVSASQSTIAAAPATIAASNGSSQSSITVTARDQFGNPVSGAAVVLDATGTGNVLTQPAGATDASGVATGTLSSTAPGDKTVSATIDGMAIVPTATVSVTAAAVDADQSSVITAPTNITASNGASQSTITVTVRDQFGNPISGATVVLAATGDGNTVNQPVGTTDISGVATGTFSSTIAGAKTISATVGVTPITETAAITVTAAALSAEQSTVSASPDVITASDGSSQSTITVTARDAFGNPISGLTVALTASGSDNTLVQPAAVTDASGVATGTLSSTAAETKVVSATINDVPITQTASVTVQPAAVSGSQSTVSASHTTITACSTGCQVATTAATITVTARDQFGNVISGASVTLASTGAGNGFNPAATGPTDGSGVYAPAFRSTVAQTKTISATINSVAIAQTATVTVTPAAVSASQSSISALPTIILADSIDASSITVTGRDDFGNVIGGATVELSASGSGNYFTQPGPTDASGVTTGALRTTVAESKTVSATVNGLLINATVQVTGTTP